MDVPVRVKQARMLRYSLEEHGRLENLTRSHQVSYWLLPESEQFNALQSLIDRLAERYGGPTFEPHVTVYCGPIDPRQSPATLAQQTLAGMQSLVLRSRGCAFSDQFTKSCYLQFEPDEKLHTVYERLCAASSVVGDYSLNAHMSLLYTTLDSDARAEIRSSLHLPAEVRLTTLCAVLTPASVTCAEDVQSWRLVHTMELER